MAKTIKAASWVVFVTLILLGVPRIAGMIANLFDYRAIDPDGSYAWISVVPFKNPIGSIIQQIYPLLIPIKME